MWECPDFFPLGDKHVLICSPQHMRAKGYEFHNGHNSLYFTGDYDSEKHTFEKDAPVSLDYGLDFYAPQTTLLPDGRRVMIAWMKSWDSCVIKEKQRWQGMMTLPRELEYRDGKIWQKPVREIENYRKNRCCYENVKVGESLRRPWPKDRSDCGTAERRWHHGWKQELRKSKSGSIGCVQ